MIDGFVSFKDGFKELITLINCKQNDFFYLKEKIIFTCASILSKKKKMNVFFSLSTDQYVIE